MNDIFFIVFFSLLAAMSLIVVVFSFTITKAQVDKKEKTGDLDLSKAQRLLLSAFSLCFWTLVFYCIGTIIQGFLK